MNEFLEHFVIPFVALFIVLPLFLSFLMFVSNWMLEKLGL